jgi:hypothetical protein
MRWRSQQARDSLESAGCLVLFAAELVCRLDHHEASQDRLGIRVERADDHDLLAVRDLRRGAGVGAEYLGLIGGVDRDDAAALVQQAESAVGHVLRHAAASSPFWLNRK